MATIEIPDSMVPLGYEVERPEVVHYLGANTPNDTRLDWIDVRVFIRRKPRLKQVVFTVAGEPRKIRPNEWFMSSEGEVLFASCNGSDQVRTPLHREEVYE